MEVTDRAVVFVELATLWLRPRLPSDTVETVHQNCEAVVRVRLLPRWVPNGPAGST